MSGELDWAKVCDASDLDVDEVLKVETAVGPVAIYRLDDGYFATQDLCSHDIASLAEGYVDDGMIECPWHGAKFCIRTGEAMTPPAYEPLTRYPLRVEDDAILIGLPAAG